jgi:hypothetical protein
MVSAAKVGSTKSKQTDMDGAVPNDSGEKSSEKGYGSKGEDAAVVTDAGQPAPKLGPYLTQLRCQVDGCTTDLKHLKEYHQRYRICAEHLKCDFIYKDGVKVRFCQQCGKFQSLVEFDAGKRSCRDRLRKHNERRRKRINSGAPVYHGEGEDFSNNHVQSNEMQLELVANLVAYIMACRDESANQIKSLLTGGDIPSQSLSENADAISAAQLISMSLNLGRNGVSPKPLLAPENVVAYLIKNFARIFHYKVDHLKISPVEEIKSVPAYNHDGLSPEDIVRDMIMPNPPPSKNVGPRESAFGPVQGARVQQQQQRYYSGHMVSPMGHNEGMVHPYAGLFNNAPAMQPHVMPPRNHTRDGQGFSQEQFLDLQHHLNSLQQESGFGSELQQQVQQST